MTIGLSTISFNKLVNKNSTAIIMAAGEGKASVVRAGIEDDANPSLPSTILHSFQGGRFYITHGAAIALTARKAEKISNISETVVDWALTYLSGVNTNGNSTLTAHLVEPPKDYVIAETILYDTSLKTGIPVHNLTVDDLKRLKEGEAAPAWIRNNLAFQILRTCASRRLRDKIEGGLRACDTTNTSILHTAPHHDDIMLSYHAAMHGLLGRDPANKLSDTNDNSSIKRPHRRYHHHHHHHHYYYYYYYYYIIIIIINVNINISSITTIITIIITISIAIIIIIIIIIITKVC